MTHYIRDMETHLKNTWQWDAWGFTSNWANKCTMSDMDGFVPYFAERRGKFLIVEMKHWDGTGQRPDINMRAGQSIALWELSKQQNFIVVFGMGDTSTHTVHYYEVWAGGERTTYPMPFKQYLDQWFQYATGK
jgi:hypothetical protein